jgi:heme O synthase-like polyprenyltransferase
MPELAELLPAEALASPRHPAAPAAWRARTASRPVAAGRVAPASAVAFGLALSALAFLVLTVFTNVLDGAFGVLARRVWREPTSGRAAALFHYSLLYLALLFVAVSVDAVIRLS